MTFHPFLANKTSAQKVQVLVCQHDTHSTCFFVFVFLKSILMPLQIENSAFVSQICNIIGVIEFLARHSQNTVLHDSPYLLALSHKERRWIKSLDCWILTGSGPLAALCSMGRNQQLKCLRSTLLQRWPLTHTWASHFFLASKFKLNNDLREHLAGQV